MQYLRLGMPSLPEDNTKMPPKLEEEGIDSDPEGQTGWVSRLDGKIRSADIKVGSGHS